MDIGHHNQRLAAPQTGLTARTGVRLPVTILLGLMVFGLILGILLGCRCPVPGLIHIYDLGGGNLMQCSSITLAEKGGSQGAMRCSAPDGEKFQGEWMTMTAQAEAAGTGIWASAPIVANNNLAARWSWANSIGVDMEDLKGSYGIFLLYGSKGTVIDGVFLFRPAAPGILGAAKDNKGHRYKIMG